jgi:hypothetical protein
MLAFLNIIYLFLKKYLDFSGKLFIFKKDLFEVGFLGGFFEGFFVWFFGGFFYCQPCSKY